jgi:hypothetical protein
VKCRIQQLKNISTMKTTILAAALFLTAASGAAFAQSTTISTNPKQKAETGSTTDSSAAKNTPGTSSSNTTGERKTSDGAQHDNRGAATTATQPGRDSHGGSRVKPGGEAESGQASGSASANATSTGTAQKSDMKNNGNAADKRSMKTGKNGRKDGGK